MIIRPHSCPLCLTEWPSTLRVHTWREPEGRTQADPLWWWARAHSIAAWAIAARQSQPALQPAQSAPPIIVQSAPGVCQGSGLHVGNSGEPGAVPNTLTEWNTTGQHRRQEPTALWVRLTAVRTGRCAAAGRTRCHQQRQPAHDAATARDGGGTKPRHGPATAAAADASAAETPVPAAGAAPQRCGGRRQHRAARRRTARRMHVRCWLRWCPQVAAVTAVAAR